MTALDQPTLQKRLDELVATFGVPGASVAVLTPAGVVSAAAGVLNRDTGVATTTDSLFQIGSITKLYTAALLARLADRDEIDLDELVVTYLPEFRVADETASRTTTLRHLLSHTSGIDGDHFLDTGRGDDVLEKYLTTCVDLEQQFPVGASMSYCNAGFAVLGRVLETVTGKVWDQVLKDELLTPLGLERSFTLPEECLRFRTACGHVGQPGALTLAPQWGLPRSSGPMGLINATAEDVVRFGEVVLRGGAAADGTPWLRPETLAAILEPQVDVPNPYTLGDAWTSGWIRWDALDGRAVYGHDGATIGQGAALRVVPDRGVAVAVLSNGGGMADLIQAVTREVLAETADVELRPLPTPVEGASGGDRSTQVGRYVRASATIDLAESGATGLTLAMTLSATMAAILGPKPVEVELLPVEEDVYVGRMPGADGWTSFVFYSLPDGSRYVHFGARATARVG